MGNVLSYRGGNLLSYAESGNRDGLSVLVQHGMIASIHDDHLFSRLIEAGTRLISVARPGYGASSPYEMRDMAEWGDIVALLVAELNLSHFDVLGISSGAPYSYAIGRTLPRKVRNIFILSGTPALYDDTITAFWPYPIDREDDQVPFITAEMTSRLLPNCQFEIRETGEHFSRQVLDDFIERAMIACYKR